MKLNRDFLQNEYSRYKQLAVESLQKEKVEATLNYATYCATLAWHYPVVYNFVDDELESLLEDATKKIIHNNNDANSPDPADEKKVVFYNGQIIDSGGLTEQYLNFFIEQNYTVLFIVPDHKNTNLGAGILQKIAAHKNTSLFIPDKTSTTRRVVQIYDAVKKFNPSKAFLHFLPADVVGFCVFCRFNSFIRFYIVHNDHTFWLGKKCSDFFIEFRQFGHQIATLRRGIDSEKLLMIPYYPLIQTASFQGFPFNRSGKVVGLSGANLYKYYGDPGLSYFHAIKSLLIEHPDFIFCLAGWGNTRIVEHFIKENDLQDRFYFLGKRKDFYQLVGAADILFESYPFKGGLTVLYATNQHIPVCGIANMKNASQSLETFFDMKVDYKEPRNIDSFINDAGSLIRVKEKRNERAALFSNTPNNKPEFGKRLKLAIEGNCQSLKRSYTDMLTLNDDYFLDEYLNQPGSRNSLLSIKFFLLKNEMTFRERIQLLKKIDTAKLPLKRKLRYLLLAVTKK